jgi:hypothetical protein
LFSAAVPFGTRAGAGAAVSTGVGVGVSDFVADDVGAVDSGTQPARASVNAPAISTEAIIADARLRCLMLSVAVRVTLPSFAVSPGCPHRF